MNHQHLSGEASKQHSTPKFIHEKFDKNKLFAWQKSYGVFTYKYLTLLNIITGLRRLATIWSFYHPTFHVGLPIFNPPDS